MKNPFLNMAMASLAAAQLLRSRALQAFKAGVFVEPDRPRSYAKKNGLTTAAVKRAAIKARNRAKHRRACRGS